MQINKLLLGLTLLGISSSFVRAQAPIPDPTPLITVTGEGEARVDPDMATVRLGIQGQGKTAQEVQAQVNEKMQKILAGVENVGVAKKEIQTGTLSLVPIYSEIKAGQTTPPVVVAYRAQNSLTIRVLDVAKTGSVVDASIAGGANTVDGVDFGLRDDTSARQEALKKAVKAAAAKAMTIAEALNVKLSRVFDASESTATNVMPFAFGRAAAMANDLSTPVAQGQVSVTATVTIKYVIAQ